MHIVDFISPERLETFQKLTDRQEKAIALHNHTLQLGSSLMSMIALLELSLRNSTNRRLVEDFGDKDWLVSGQSSLPLKKTEKDAISSAKKHAQKAAYSKLSYREKGLLDVFVFPEGKPSGTSHKTEVRKRTASFHVTQGQVIAQTTIYFWKRLYSREYEDALWKRSLKRVFPNKKIKRSEISVALEIVYAARNRVAHHEPMYGERLDDVMNALATLRDQLGATDFGRDTSFQKFSRIQYLRLRMDYESFQEAWRTLT